MKQGFEVASNKVDNKNRNNKDVTILDFLPNANNLKTTEIGISKIISRLFYLVNNSFTKSNITKSLD